MAYRVVVIDDNVLITEAISKLINSEKLDCCVVGTAGDGMEGKKIISSLKPDIIITDIKMPGFDGLDMAKMIKPLVPHAKIIVITGYQDFNYAQKAVKLGIFDFILKPINEKQLCKIIKVAVMQIKKEKIETNEKQKVIEENKNLQIQINETLPALRKNFILQLINNDINKDNITEVLSKLKLSPKGFVVMLLRLKSNNNGLTGYMNDALIKLRRIEDIEIIHVNRDGSLVISIFFNKSFAEREIRIIIKTVFRCIRECFEKDKAKCYSTCSSFCKEVLCMGKAYEEAAEMLSRAMFFMPEADGVIFPEQDMSKEHVDNFSIMFDVNEFIENISTIDDGELSKLIDGFLVEAGRFSKGDIFVAKGLISYICFLVTMRYSRSTSSENRMSKNINEVLADIKELNHISQTREYVLCYINQIRESLKKGNRIYSLTVKNALAYIKSHVNEELTLSCVADRFSVNPAYLSGLIKKETGENFIILVAKAKLDRAKKLLSDPRYTVDEIGKMVGYKNYAHFYQVFKKYEGISPKEFKNKS